jgi:hypothetical protein
MQNSWQSFLERLWPSRSGPTAENQRRTALLKALIAMVIILASGPEIIAAMEMTTLLELLGATLFLTAFAAGARLAVEDVWRFVRGIVLPADQLLLMRSNLPLPAKIHAVARCTANVMLWLGGVLVCGRWVHEMVYLAI